ncbi:uncharacterized protein ATNIH1004_011280 [Aspergillus tanneri]|uniref:Uncharacterized protein n=1 Tax=Aspergillus tanneri TaxID=1220188 RepID=A0A5M9M9M9_9EURO|nr:uncharacterized protein ATNIH1004_011280 [Aspergillus tanneri]KAA8642336.1 hypothetical protein ATNIH1004_011280 [Aspergillus tanneri]
MSKGGKQKVDRRAVAAANGYVRGANREQDQHRCEYYYSDESLSLQDKVLSVYVLWASEEDEELRGEGLHEGQPAPDLATVKDFIRFYIFSSHGMISLRPTKSSVLNFAERFFAGVQLTFAILIYCYSGARIGTFIPDTSKADVRGLRYEDIELYIYRRPDGEIELFFRLSEIWVKNNDNPKNTVFRVAMREHGKLRFNPVAFLLEMAFQDGAFLHMDSLESLKRWNPDHNEPTPLLWDPSVAKEPVLRRVTRFGGISKSPWTRECFCRLFRAVVSNAGYPEIITIHTLRRGLANRLDKVATEAERSQILTQKDPNIFGRSYIDSTSALSSMDAFLGEAMRLDHIEYLRGVGKYRAIGYPRQLPAERQHAIRQNKDLQDLEQRLRELTAQQAVNDSDKIKDEDEDEDEDKDLDGADEDDKFAIKLTKKQVQVLKTRLYNTELAKYRDEWIQSRVETQVKSGGKASDVIVYNDITHCLFRAQPDRQRVAEMMPSDKLLSYQETLSMVENLLSYCTKDYNVFYRPGEEPVNGRCPVGGCSLNGIWDEADVSVDFFGKEDSAQGDVSASTERKRRQPQVRRKDQKRRRLGRGDFQIVQWESPNSATDLRTPPLANSTELNVKIWSHAAKASSYPAVEEPALGYIIAPTLKANDDSGLFNNINSSSQDDSTLCVSDSSTLHDLTTRCGSEPSTPNTSPDLLPIDPEILQGDTIPLIGFGGQKSDLRDAKESREPESCRYSLETKVSPVPGILHVDNSPDSEEINSSADEHTDTDQVNIILETSSTETREQRCRTPSATDALESLLKPGPLSSDNIHAGEPIDHPNNKVLFRDRRQVSQELNEEKASPAGSDGEIPGHFPWQVKGVNSKTLVPPTAIPTAVNPIKIK